MHSQISRWLCSLLLVAAGLGAGVDAAQAQYFGRNKVQYETFDFRVIKTEHFDVYYYDDEKEAALEAARMAERWYARQSRLMDHSLRGRQPLILYASHPHFEQTNALFGQIGEGTGGVTEPLKRRVVLPMAGPLAETDHVVGHELVHAFQFSLTGSDPTSPMFQLPGVSALPLWMVEGMAEYLAKGGRDPLTAMWMRDALYREEGLPTVHDLANARKYFPYRYGQALWAYIGGRWGDEKVNEIFRGAARTGSPAQAMYAVLGLSPDTLSLEWHAALEEAYAPVLKAKGEPEEFGTRLVGPEADGGRVNISPSLSPDGERLVFLSEKSLFAIEMYLADARTGEIIRRLTRTAVDPHYQSLQFINSAGAWSSDARRFALAAVSEGQPVLSIIDPEDGSQVKEFRLTRFGEIHNPTWGPGDDRIAFVANDGGFTDLFVLEVATGDVGRLTHDPYAELHPTWSPDGQRIAFVTDRFEAELGELGVGDYRLALIDARTTEIRPVSTFEGVKSVNPQWSPDGGSLYFVGGREGIPNVYRVELATGELFQLTDVLTGVSGYTALSPSISVARESGALAFAAFEEGGFNIYRVDGEERLAGTPVTDRDGVFAAGELPPAGNRADSRLAGFLSDPGLGLPDPVTFQVADYEPSLSLDYVSQPSLAFGFSDYGSFVGGGASLHFSDMLGFYNLTSLLHLQIIDGEVLNGLGALVGYTNKRTRWNWGVLGGQVPQLYRLYRGGFVDTDGDDSEEFVQEITRFWQINRQVTGAVEYPFSPVQRLELGGGFTQTAFDLQTQRRVFELTGQPVSSETVDAEPCDGRSFRVTFCKPGTLTEAMASVALVYDNSIMGPTGPVLGQRYRMGVSPSVGTVDYLSVTTDYRRYLMPFGPVTLAGRLLHHGRYGGGADDQRLRQLFIGYPSLVRGYDTGSFDFGVCPPGQRFAQCSEAAIVDRLLGTKMLVGNAELRLPLFGPLGVLGSGTYVPPVDLIGFYDAGVAWFSDDPETTDVDERAFLLGGDRDLVTSAGLGLRINLLGFAVAEVDWVTPFDRPDKGSYLQFALNPGF